MGFCQCFCFFFGGSLPKVFGKISLDVRSAVFWVRSLFVWFFRRRRFFLRETDQVVIGHPSHAPVLVCSFFVLCPAAHVFARFGRASRFLRFPRGAFLGPVRFWDSPGTCSEACFLGREAAGVFRASCAWFFLFPFCFVLRPHVSRCLSG